MVTAVILCPTSWATHKSLTIYCGMLNSYWTSVLLVEPKSTSSSQHWFHSPSQLAGQSVIHASGLPFLEHFRWVFGCEWALGMRFEEDYQGPESCLGASCAFRQNCRHPCCISVGKMWCVSLSLSPSFCLCLSHSLSGSDIEKHDCRGWQWYLGLLSFFFDDAQPFVACVAAAASHLHLSSLCLWPSWSCLSWGLYMSGEVAGYCCPRTGHLA